MRNGRTIKYQHSTQINRNCSAGTIVFCGQATATLYRRKLAVLACLAGTPHITIIPPLALTSVEIIKVQEIAREIASKCNPFRLSVHKYGSFKPRVIFMKPEVPPGLSDLYQNWRDTLKETLPHVLEKYPDRPYHPHITLAHRDIDRQQFEEMWKYYKNKKIDMSIEINQYCILAHSKEGWKIEATYILKSN